jgi:hypothetical protein
MKKYLFILIVLLAVSCAGTKERRDQMAYIYNFSIPEALPFELDTPVVLTEGIFDALIPDSAKMIRLEEETNVQILKILDEMYYAQLGLTIRRDASFYRDARFFVYGKLDLQEDIQSIVIWEYWQDFARTFWLFNLKNDKLCSVAQLILEPEWYLDFPPSSSNTYLRDGIFTTLSISNDCYHYFWNHPEGSVQGFKDEITENAIQFTHYQVNEEGFIEFVDKEYRKNKSRIPVLPVGKK